jgi:hypothetical protein
MSIITHVDYNSSSDSIAYSDNMSISSSTSFPLIAYQGQCTPTSDLEYAPKEPSPIQFGNAEPIKPIILRPLKLENEHSDEDESHPLSPDSPFNEAYPAQVRIKVEEFEDNHNTREVEAKDQQAADLNSRGDRLIRQLGEQLIKELSTTDEKAPEDVANVPSDVRRSLDLLHKVLCTKFDPPQVAHTTDDDDSFTARSSGWDEDHDEEYKTLWPTPPSTPPEGDDMHPPQLSISGPYPGQGWVINTPGTNHYYRFLIPDPTTRRSIVAPYLSYSINRSKPEVSGTYGEGYPVYTRPLTAASVDYICPTVTVDQQRLLDPEAPFADAVNHVINNYFPYDLAAAVRQYQYFRETQYAIQKSINQLREKEMRYMEQAIGTLSELENANILGRLLAHDGDVVQYLCTHGNPRTYLAYSGLSNSFKGQVTRSALDTRVLQRSPTPRRIISLPLNANKRLEEEKEDKKDLEELEQTLRNRLHTRISRERTHVPTNIPLHLHARKRCHRCNQWGHIRATCPDRPYGRTARQAAHRK